MTTMQLGCKAWDAIHADYKIGDPDTGTAKVLVNENGATVLVDVTVVPSLLLCDGWCGRDDDRTKPQPFTIAMIDDKGWIYCEPCGRRRQMSRPCRALQPDEIDRLLAGQCAASHF